MPPLPIITATVLSNPYIAEETRGIRLRIHDSKFLFHAGQFINIIIKDKIFRAYSIASSPSFLPELELCVKIVEGGVGTTYIDQLQQGDTVSFTGPFGHFGLKNNGMKKLLVATGTGIAPMKAIVDEERVLGLQKSVHLIFGVREEKFAPYKEYFEEVSKKEKDFSFDLYISRGEKNPHAHSGRVTSFLIEQKPEFFRNTEVLICGSPGMVKEVKEILMNEKGVEKANIIVEVY